MVTDPLRLYSDPLNLTKDPPRLRAASRRQKVSSSPPDSGTWSSEHRGSQRRGGGRRRGAAVLPGKRLTHVQRCEERAASRAVCQEGVSPTGSFTQKQNEQSAGKAHGPSLWRGPGQDGAYTCQPRGRTGPRGGGREATAPALWPQLPRSGAKKDELACQVPQRGL